MPAEAFAIHGLARRVPQGQAAFRRNRRRFHRLHRRRAAGHPQCGFDLGFLIAELERIERGRRSRASGWSIRCCWRGASIRSGPTVSTHLCVRYGIDNSRRTKHGALLDAEILAEVYLELIGARQAQLGLSKAACGAAAAATAPIDRARTPGAAGAAYQRSRSRSAPRLHRRRLGETPSWRELSVEFWMSRLRRAGSRRLCSCAGGRARRNRSDRAAAAGSRRCAPRSRRSRARTETAGAGIRSAPSAFMLSGGTFWMRNTPANSSSKLNISCR